MIEKLKNCVNWYLIGATAVWALTLLLILFFSTVLHADWQESYKKSAGELITISWDWPGFSESEITGFSIDRSTSVYGPYRNIGSVPNTFRRFTYIMPSGTTKQYRFRIHVVDLNGEISPAGPEVIVDRK